MTIINETTFSDLMLFSDLGTEVPHIVRTPTADVLRMARDGLEIELSFKSDGSIQERDSEGSRRHINFQALLASPNFGNLGRWADSQKSLLTPRKQGNLLPVSGVMSGNATLLDIYAVDDTLLPSVASEQNSVKIMLVDGPAGIGKTSFLQMLSLKRAENYRVHRRPLVLHVESRGRLLQNLLDLMAFSLQTLRLSVTYDQVPILVKRGLVTLAIDGFDELGDPSGYELAWAQVNDLIDDIRGSGTLLLAGRETFIGKSRLSAALTGLREERDILDTFTLQPPKPSEAKEWLIQSGWDESIFAQENVQPLFEKGSYALRPFFLYELSSSGIRDQIVKGDVEDLLWYLVDAMIIREAGKFGSDVERVSSETERKSFVLNLLQEVSRDLAENQTEAISAETLSWLAEVAASSSFPEEVVGILKNRAGVIAFLTEDDRRGFKRFSHAQLQNHFLARITVSSIIEGELPKYVRRNIFGAEFLASFADVAKNLADTTVRNFIRSSLSVVERVSNQDRSRRNLGSLVIASMASCPEDYVPELRDLSIDEALVIETSSKILLNNVTIAQFDIRNADISRFEFGEQCYVLSLIANDGTLLPRNMPIPVQIQAPDEVINEPHRIITWIEGHSSSHTLDTTLIPEAIRDHDLFRLLGRVARHNSFWIREGEENKVTRKILDNAEWTTLRDILLKTRLLTTRSDIPARGQASSFYHLRRRQEIAQEDLSDTQVHLLYEMITAHILSESSQVSL